MPQFETQIEKEKQVADVFATLKKEDYLLVLDEWNKSRGIIDEQSLARNSKADPEKARRLSELFAQLREKGDVELVAKTWDKIQLPANEAEIEYARLARERVSNNEK